VRVIAVAILVVQLVTLASAAWGMVATWRKVRELHRMVTRQLAGKDADDGR
jgi:hypothetical protein